MHKRFFLFTILISFLNAGFNCNKDNDRRISGCLKGKLEIKGICMNYFISVKEGYIDPSFVESTWQDPITGNNYQNVFRLASPCSFPPSINERDEFYFYVVENSPNNCVVCLAFRPTPQKSLEISISSKPCM